MRERVACVVSLLVRLTVSPPAGAACDRVIVPVAVLPSRTFNGLKLTASVPVVSITFRLPVPDA